MGWSLPSAHTDTSPRVGFHSNEPSPQYWTGTDQELLDGATQAVYDLAVEATAKAGPWTLGQGVGATGVVLTGANGPIEGEIVNFDDGSDDGIDIVTDANGFAAWPAGATLATAEGPSGTYETPGDTSDGEEGQNIIITIGEDLVLSTTRPPRRQQQPRPRSCRRRPQQPFHQSWNHPSRIATNDNRTRSHDNHSRTNNDNDNACG